MNFNLDAQIVSSNSREGVIIEWPLNGHFNDVVIDVLMSRTNVREMEDNDDDDKLTLGNIFYW